MKTPKHKTCLYKKLVLQLAIVFQFIPLFYLAFYAFHVMEQWKDTWYQIPSMMLTCGVMVTHVILSLMASLFIWTELD